MRFQRLFEMSPAELAFRGRQEVFKAVERLSLPTAGDSAACHFDRAAIDPSMRRLLERSGTGDAPAFSAELKRQLQDKVRRRFFAGLQDAESCAELSRAWQEDPAFNAQELLARANAICRQDFAILGYGELSFGQPVNWHLDPVSGQESPRVHWSRLDPLAPEQVGDSKVVWELNRHQWMLDLGQAYQLSGDEKYATCFVTLLDDWIARNPVAWGVNWSSALEVAMRVISWAWALNFFQDSPALTPQRYQTILGCLQAHAGFVERYLSRYFAPNTHLTVEALALYYMGTLLPELRGAGRWRALGRRLLLEQLPLQVPDGGVYFEQSTRYQYYTIEIYLHFAILAARNDDSLPELVKLRLGEMLHFLLDVRRPDGSVPQIGDTDGGWLCPLVRRGVGDYRGLFSTAALFLNDPQLAWAGESITTEASCLLGTRASDDWQSLGSEAPSRRRFGVQYPEGYVVMRNGWGPQAHQLIFDTGPLGCHICAGHGHADLLAVQCSAYGENYLVDPGTGCYTAGSAWREYFRSSQAHSTVLVDGLGQATPDGPFSWHERPAAQLLDFDTGTERIFAAAQHDAYARLPDPVTHRRRVWFLDSAVWLIVDDLLGAVPHQVDLRFQFAPLPVRLEQDGWVRATGAASCLLLKTFSTSELQTELVTGEREPALGWYSPNYGQMVPAPALNTRAQDQLPLRFATLIMPMRDPAAAPPQVQSNYVDGLLAGLSISESELQIPEFGAELESRADSARMSPC